jgi:hypothetical protein
MRYITIILLILTWGHALSQADYDKIFLKRLDELKKLEIYDYFVVVYADSDDVAGARFPYWKSNELYYQDDFVRYNYLPYRVLSDSSIGQRPDTARTTWAVSGHLHPFLFLRDTAKLTDLRRMMLDNHAYVRSYAFAALSYRKSKNLFPLIADNLKDTTILKIHECVYEEVYPADLMIEYEIDRLTDIEKKKLSDLIKSKFRYLTRGLSYLDRK